MPSTVSRKPSAAGFPSTGSWTVRRVGPPVVHGLAVGAGGHPADLDRVSGGVGGEPDRGILSMPGEGSGMSARWVSAWPAGATICVPTRGIPWDLVCDLLCPVVPAARGDAAGSPHQVLSPGVRAGCHLPLVGHRG